MKEQKSIQNLAKNSSNNSLWNSISNWYVVKQASVWNQLQKKVHFIILLNKSNKLDYSLMANLLMDFNFSFQSLNLELA